MKYLIWLCLAWIACGDQKPDLTYDTQVAHPAYVSEHPKVLFDEAHNNFHTATGRYSPFVNLIKSDGYDVTGNKDLFTANKLSGYKILVISNAKGIKEKYEPAFTHEECHAVREWVQSGGSLLLIADHYPMGSAAQTLASTFGVHMNNGYVSDSVNYEGDAQFKDQLVFSRENHLLKNHSIMEGRSTDERVSKVVTFTGQSLKSPDDAFVLLELGSSAVEAIPDSIWTIDGKTYTRFQDPVPIPGRCQGLAMNFGKGRVVVLGEAAMLTAQIADGKKFGMNVPGNDNRQFALNVVHWLSGLY
jgi:hypothetical protein